MASGVATSLSGGPDCCNSCDEGGLVVARPAMAPCKSDRVSPPDAFGAAGAAGVVVVSFELGAGVATAAVEDDDVPDVVDGCCGIPRFSRMFDKVST